MIAYEFGRPAQLNYIGVILSNEVTRATESKDLLFRANHGDLGAPSFRPLLAKGWEQQSITLSYRPERPQGAEWRSLYFTPHQRNG